MGRTDRGANFKASETTDTERREAAWLHRTAAAARVGDEVLRRVLTVIAILFLLFFVYGLIDDFRILNGADLDQSLLQYKPAVGSEGSNPSLEELMAINPDVRAWLTIPDTTIDYPVLQGEDNSEYLNKDVYGQFALSGSIFLDSRNASDFSDPYSLVYGHHMDAGKMFGALDAFEKKDYLAQHDTGYLYLKDASWKITFFACVKTDAYEEVVFNPTTSADGDEALLAYIKKNAVAETDGFADGDGAADVQRIIGLSTCADNDSDARTVLFGYLEEDN